MKSSFPFALVVLSLSGCGPGASPTNAGGANSSNIVPAAKIAPDHDAPAVAAAPAPNAEEAAVRAMIVKGYRDEMSDIFSPAFKRVWDRALGKEGGMDVDIFCECQDPGPKPSVRVVGVTISGSTAVARVDYKNDQPKSRWAHHRLTFVKTPQGWLLDDFSNGRGKSLKDDMASSPPGSWNDF